MIILEAFNIDLADLNYVYSSSIFSRFLKGSASALPRKGLILRIGVYFYKLFKLIRPSEWLREFSISPNTILFFSMSKNQNDCIYPVSSKLSNSCVFGKETEYPFSFTTLIAHLISIPFFVVVLYHFLQSKGVLKLSYKYNLDRYWLTFGYYITVRLWLRRKKPKILILANDHIMECRTMLKAAKDEGIITGYIQHASVTSEFPTLKFDYAFLEGRDALNTYSNIGKSKTTVFLVGSSKFDGYHVTVNSKAKLESIGICTNSLDPIDKVAALSSCIKEKFSDIQITLRPHPGDKRIAIWKKIATERGLKYSDPNSEDSFSCLEKIDGLIAGNSNIHLEAVLMNVYPLFYDFSQKPDLIKYTFIKNNLVEYFSDIPTIIEKIDSLIIFKKNIRFRAKPYIDTLGTIYDGSSSNIVAKIIIEIAHNNSVNTLDWIKIQSKPIEAYSRNDKNSIYEKD